MRTKKINKLVLIFSLSLIFFGLVTELILWYYGGPILEKSIQKIVDRTTDNQYIVKFSKLRVNFFTRSLFIENFKLIPDTSKNTNQNLYYISFDQFNIKQVSLLQLITQKKIKIRKVSLSEPIIKFYKFTSAPIKTENPITYEIIKRDFLASILKVFNGIYIEDVIISGGKLDFLKDLKYQNFTAKNISLLLHNFRIDKNSFFEKSLFADKIQIQIDNYQILLKNNHQFSAEKLIISTTDRNIILQDAKLKPLHLSDTSNNIFFSTQKIFLQGIDFTDIYLNQNLITKDIDFQNINLSIYTQKNKQENPISAINILKGIFKNIQIKTINLNNINFRIYKNFREGQPFIYLKNGNVNLYGINITPSSQDLFQSFDDLKIFFPTFQAKILNNTHLLNIYSLNLDSKKQDLNIKRLDIIPIYTQTSINKFAFLTNLHLRQLKINGFNLIQIISGQDLNLRNVLIKSGNINITQLKPSHKSKKKKIPNIKIRNLQLVNQKFDIRIINAQKQNYFTGIASIIGKKINIRSNPDLANINLNIEIKDFQNYSPQNITQISLKYGTINTSTREVLLKDIAITPNKKADSLLRIQHKASVINLIVPIVKIDSIDLKRLIKDKIFSIENLSLIKPDIKILHYPEILAKKYKKQIRESIRKKAVKALVLEASQKSFNLYQSTKEFNDSTYKQYKKIALYIDSIQNLAIDIIFKIHIPEKHIKLSDTTAQNIEQLKNLAIQSFDRLIEDPNHSDTIFLTTVYKLINIKKQTEKPGFQFDILKDLLLNDINGIRTKKIILKDAKLSLIQKYQDKEINIFKNIISLKFINFKLNKTQDCKNRVLCSDYIIADIKKYQINLPDSIHSIELNKLNISTLDSSIRIYDLYIHADTNKNSLFPSKVFVSAYIPEIDFLNINFTKLSDSNILYLNKVIIPKSFFHLINNPITKDIKKKVQQKLNLPFKQISINRIEAQKNNIRYFNKKDSIDIYAETKFSARYFKLDSQKQPLENIPVKFYQTSFYNIKIKKTDSIKIKTKELNFNSYGYLWSKNLNLNIKDSIIIKYDSLFINNFFPLKIFQNKKIHFSWIFMNNPEITLLNNQKHKHQSQYNIKNINLYKIITPYIYSVIIDSSLFNNIKIKTISQTINNIDIKQKYFRLDSNSQIDTPYLFYSQNIIITIKNFDKKISDLYSITFDTLNINLKKQNLYIKNFHYYPNYSAEEFCKRLKWRKTLTDFYSSTIEAKKIQWDSILFKNIIKANIISFKRFNLFAYTDRNIPHDYSKIKPHLIDLILKSPIPLAINNIILQQGQIIYEEKAPEHSMAGHIELNNVNIIASNIFSNLKSPDQIKLNISGSLMNKAPLNIYAYFQPDTINYKFRMYGRLEQMDLTALNPFMIYATDIKLKSGYLDKAEFLIKGSDSIATGILKANYNDLRISILKPNGLLQPKKRAFLSMAANVIVRKENPKYGVIYRIGTIAYIHDRSFSDIKFWVKALISGIKSLVLFENKKEVNQINRLKMRFSANSNP